LKQKQIPFSTNKTKKKKMEKPTGFKVALLNCIWEVKFVTKGNENRTKQGEISLDLSSLVPPSESRG